MRPRRPKNSPCLAADETKFKKVQCRVQCRVFAKFSAGPQLLSEPRGGACIAPKVTAACFKTFPLFINFNYCNQGWRSCPACNWLPRPEHEKNSFSKSWGVCVRNAYTHSQTQLWTNFDCEILPRRVGETSKSKFRTAFHFWVRGPRIEKIWARETWPMIWVIWPGRRTVARHPRAPFFLAPWTALSGARLAP